MMVTEILVSASRNPDGPTAINEIISSLHQKITRKPSFMLIFTTIHYKQKIGEILKKVSEELSEGTPLIGGTMPGFATKEGVFTRGIAIAAYFSDDFTVFPVIGRNTKKNPKKAANEIIQMIAAHPENKKFKTKVLLEFISGPTVPQFPFMRRKKVIRNEAIGKTFSFFSKLFLETFQNGVGREEEVLEELSNSLKDWNIIGGSTLDDNNLADNLQFYGTSVHRNSIVGLVLLTNKEAHLSTTYGLKEDGKKIEIVLKDGNERIISKIDSISAVKGLLNKTQWFEDDLDERLYRRTFHYTIGFTKNGILYPEVIGACYGNDIWVGYKIDGDDAKILTATGNKILESVKNNLTEQSFPIGNFFFLTCCASILETLGRKNYLIKDEIEKQIQNREYIMIYVGGEDTYSEKHGCRHVNYSFNTLTLRSQ